MNDFFKAVIISIASTLVVTFILNLINNGAEDVYKIEFTKFISDDINKELGELGDLKITFKDNSIKSLHRTSYRVLNRTKINLEKIKVYFYLKDKSILPIHYNVTANNKFKSPTVKYMEDGVYLIEYDFLNRIEKSDIWEQPSINFYFTEKNNTNFILESGSKGIEIEKYDYQDTTFFEFLSYLIKSRVFILFIIFSFLYFVVFSIKFAEFNLTRKNIIFEIDKLKSLEGVDINENKNEIIKAYDKDISIFEVAKYYINTFKLK